MTPTTSVTRDCQDCGDLFPWDSSPDLDRCQSCAGYHEGREGATNHEALRPSVVPAGTEA